MSEGKLRNSKVKLRWVVVVGGGGGMRGFSRQIDFVDLVNYYLIVVVLVAIVFIEYYILFIVLIGK